MLLAVVLLLYGPTLAGTAEVILRDAVVGDRKTSVTVIPKQSVPDAATLSPKQINSLAHAIQDDALNQFLTVAAISVSVMVVFACVVGWWVAGRVLRPLHTITVQARSMSARNIHDRLVLDGPPDELRDLADTFNGMLDRLDRAFTSQRRFVADASHELRTPLAIERAIMQVRLANAGPAEIGQVRAELLAANRRLDRLLEGLLLLARSDNGLPERHPVDLAAVADRVVRHTMANAPAGAPEGVRSRLDAVPLTVLGDEVLLTQLVDNLVRNAMLYNVPGGWFTVTLTATGTLTVANSGQPVPPDTVDGLFEPFHRGTTRRVASPTGAGLGLAIARSITEAHDGTVTAASRPSGGLDVTVRLPMAQ